MRRLQPQAHAEEVADGLLISGLIPFSPEDFAEINDRDDDSLSERVAEIMGIMPPPKSKLPELAAAERQDQHRQALSAARQERAEACHAARREAMMAFIEDRIGASLLSRFEPRDEWVCEVQRKRGLESLRFEWLWSRKEG